MPPNDAPNARRWNDDRLDDLAQDVRLVLSNVRVIAVMEQRVNQAEHERADLRSWLQDVEARLLREIGRVDKECDEHRREVREQFAGLSATRKQEREQAAAASRTLVLAVIAGGATVLAAIIAAAAAVIGAQ